MPRNSRRAVRQQKPGKDKRRKRRPPDEGLSKDRDSKRVKLNTVNSLAANCFVCRSLSGGPSLRTSSKGDHSREKITLGKDGWQFRALKTVNSCLKLSLTKSIARNEFPEGRWALDLEGGGVTLVQSTFKETGEFETQSSFLFQKCASSETQSSSSDFNCEALGVRGQDWQVNYLEISETSVSLELFQPMQKFKFGGEDWEWHQERSAISVLMAVPTHELCNQHVHERLLVFKRAPRPTLQTLLDEVMLKIFGFFQPYELTMLARINRRCRRIAKDWTLWKKQLVIKANRLNAAKAAVSVGGSSIRNISIEEDELDDQLERLMSELCPKLQVLTLELHGLRPSVKFVRNFRNLTALTIDSDFIDDDKYIEALSGKLNLLQKLHLPWARFSSRSLPQVFGGKSHLTSLVLYMMSLEDVHLILDACGSELTEIEGLDVTEVTVGDGRLFDVPLKKLGIKYAHAGFIPCLGRFSDTLQVLVLEADDDLGVTGRRDLLLSVERLFRENKFHSLWYLKLNSDGIPRREENNAGLVSTTVCRSVVSRLPGLRSLDLIWDESFPSITEVLNLLNGHRPQLEVFRFEPRSVACEESFPSLFQNPGFLSRLRHLELMNPDPPELLEELHAIRPRLDIVDVFGQSFEAFPPIRGLPPGHDIWNE